MLFALQAANIGTWELDPVHQLVYWDERCRLLAGTIEDDVVPYSQLLTNVHADDRQRVDEAIQRALTVESGGQYTVDFRPGATTDAQLRWLRYQGKAYFDEQGVAYRFSGIAQDVTQDVLSRQRADVDAERLRQREAQLRSVVENTPDVITRRDKDLKLLFANTAFETKVGVALPTLLGKTNREMSQPEAVATPYMEKLQAVLNSGQPQDYYNVYPSPQGDVHFYSRLIPEFGSDGSVQSVLGIARDITALRAAERQQQATADLLQSVLNSSMVGISALASVRNEQGEIIDFEYRLANRITEQTNNRTDLVGQRYSVVHSGYQQAGLFDDFVTVVQTGRLIERERHYTGEGFNNYYTTIVAKLDDGVVLSFRDITQEVRARQQVEASEVKLRSLIEEAPVATCLFVGREMRIELANEAMIDIWGKGRSVIGQPLADALPELRNQHFLPLLDQLFTTGETHETKAGRADLVINGVLSTYYFDYTFKPLRNANGDVYAIMEMADDVTNEVKIRRELETSEARFRSIVEQAPMAIGLLRSRTMVIETGNNKLFDVWGKDPSVIERRLVDALPEIQGQGFIELLEGVYDTGEPFFGNGVPVKLNRQGHLETVYFDFVYTPLRDVKGAVTGVMVLATEVTEQVVARQKLQQSETYFRQLTDAVPAMIWITETDGQCSYLNKQWYEYTGQTEEEAQGFGWLNATHPDDMEAAGRLFLEANEMQTSFNALYRLRGRDGSYRWSIDKASPRFGVNGNYEGMIGTVVDVHDQKLAEEEKRKLIAMIEASHEFVGLADPDMAGQYMNPAGLAMLGWDSVAGKTILDCVYPEDRAIADTLLDQLRQKKHFSQEIRFMNAKTGEPFWLQWNTVAITNTSSNEIIGLGTISPNITERKKAEHSLAASEARLRSVIADAPAGIGLFMGRNLVIEMPNQTFIDMVGKGPDIAGKPLREVMPELATENQPFLQILDDVYTSGKMFQSFGSQVSIVQQGVMTHNFYNITYTPLFDVNRAVYAILEIAIDVTEQVVARREVEASQQRFRTLLEAIPPMTWTNTPVGDIDFYNQRWYDYTGLNYEQIHSSGWAAIVHPDDLPRTLANYRQALATGQDLIVENRYRRADGNYRWHLNRALPIRNEGGDITQWVGTATDIHKQKELEAELEQQVQLRTQQLQTSVQDLQRSNQNLQQFAYVASHDLQERLRKIQSFGDLLKSQYASQLGEGTDHLQRMQSAASRMSVLIKDLLMFSRISTQQDATNPVSLSTVVEGVLSDLDVVITETNARVTIEPLPTVQGDSSQLGQLFQNLLSNALKFRRPNTTPTIRVTARWVSVADLPPNVRPTRMAEGYHRIEVTDDGIGFDDKYVDRIFQVFQRLHGRNEYVGTGIGLAICEKVAANHGGAITATSQPGQGATFSVYFPVLE